jgi:hypothetical protein
MIAQTHPTFGRKTCIQYGESVGGSLIGCEGASEPGGGIGM